MPVHILLLFTVIRATHGEWRVVVHARRYEHTRHHTWEENDNNTNVVNLRYGQLSAFVVTASSHAICRLRPLTARSSYWRDY